MHFDLRNRVSRSFWVVYRYAWKKPGFWPHPKYKKPGFLQFLGCDEIDLLQKSFSSIHGTGSPAHPTRKNKSCGMGILPVLIIFARGLMFWGKTRFLTTHPPNASPAPSPNMSSNPDIRLNTDRPKPLYVKIS